MRLALIHLFRGTNFRGREPKTRKLVPRKLIPQKLIPAKIHTLKLFDGNMFFTRRVVLNASQRKFSHINKSDLLACFQIFQTYELNRSTLERFQIFGFVKKTFLLEKRDDFERKIVNSNQTTI